MKLKRANFCFHPAVGHIDHRGFPGARRAGRRNRFGGSGDLAPRCYSRRILPKASA
jgi:hypothetical protein